jgi:hypothetical protein
VNDVSGSSAGSETHESQVDSRRVSWLDVVFWTLPIVAAGLVVSIAGMVWIGLPLILVAWITWQHATRWVRVDADAFTFGATLQVVSVDRAAVREVINGATGFGLRGLDVDGVGWELVVPAIPGWRERGWSKLAMVDPADQRLGKPTRVPRVPNARSAVVWGGLCALAVALSFAA